MPSTRSSKNTQRERVDNFKLKFFLYLYAVKIKINNFIAKLVDSGGNMPQIQHVMGPKIVWYNLLKINNDISKYKTRCIQKFIDFSIFAR